MSNIIDRYKDKLQETYDRMLVEKTTFNDMGKANDAMADFLEEIEDRVDSIRFDLKGRDLKKVLNGIDKDWEKLWDKIISLTKKL